MSRSRILNSTTTAALCLALAMPAPLAAQQAAPCGEGTETPCPEGQTPEQAQQAAEEAQRQAEEAAAEAQRQVEEAAAEAQRQADEAAAAEAQRQADEAAAAEAQRQADEAAAAAQRQADEAAAAEAQRQADEAAAAEAQRLADEAAAAEAQRQANEAAAAEAQRQADEAAAAEAQRQADEAAAAEAQRQAEEATAQEADTPAAATEETATAATEQPAETPEVVQTDTADTAEIANETPEVSAAAAAPTDAGATTGTTEEAAPVAETVTETVTTEVARSSEEEFDSRIVAAPAATAAAPQSDGGLSTFEKFALAGVGIVALSAILRNNDRVAAASQDRVVVERDGGYYVIKDDDTLLRRPGSEIVTDRFADGSSRTVVYREDGSSVETIRAANGQVLRRVRYLPDGRAVLLFDDTVAAPPVQLDRLPRTRPIPVGTDPELAAALAAAELADLDRRFSLQQVRQIRAVRELVPQIDLPDVTFESGSSAIRATEAVKLRELGLYMAARIAENPDEVFLIEGHTDAVGSAAFNLALSDRRAESLALALTEYFDVPPESMVVQGYGEANLKINTQGPERANRRVAVRQITALLRTADLR